MNLLKSPQEALENNIAEYEEYSFSCGPTCGEGGRKYWLPNDKPGKDKPFWWSKDWIS